MRELRTVRKYRNRRLYDLAEGRYTTLADLRTRVAAGAELNVIDTDKVDSTASILFQMMAARETMADPSMSLDFLLHVIRSRAEGPSWMIATFLEQILKLFTTKPADLEKLGIKVDASPVQAALRLAEANYDLWCSVQNQIQQMFANAESGDLSRASRNQQGW